MKYLIGIIAVIIVVVVFFGFYDNRTAIAPSSNNSNPTSGNKSVPIQNVSILDYSRVTKKPFGIYVTPENSPVQPEKFTGYHTGADFEILPGEEDTDVSVPALCDGKLLLKEYASGYGGVAVQSCELNGTAVTVVYGHLKLSSIILSVGDAITKGDKIGILGKGYSTETDGERKHLHLGIHQGTGTNIKGYVSSKSDLNQWLDPKQFVK